MWKGKHTALLAGILISLLVFLASLTPVAEYFEWNTLDWRFKFRDQRAVESELAIVFIGDDAIRAIGRWPWPWDYHALMVDILRRHGARAVIFDVLFAEAPSATDEYIFSLAAKEADNVYMCAYFNEMEPSPYPGWPYIGTSLTEAVPALREEIKGLGHCNARPDADGITRRIPVLVSYSDEYYPSVALKVVLDHLDVPLEEVKVSQGKFIEIPLSNAPPIRVPMDEEGQTLVNFAGGLDTFENYSFLQVLQSDQYPERAMIDLDAFRDKIVLIGATFTGNTDIRPTPITESYPMLLVLANTIDNILQRDFIIRPSLLMRIFMIAFLGALTGFLAYAFRPVFSLTSTAILTVGIVGLSAYLFIERNLWIDLIAPMAVIMANYLTMTTIQYVQNRRAKIRYLEHLKYMDDLVESSNDAIVSFDLTGRIVTWNRGAEKIFGITERSALGSHWETIISPQSREGVSEALEYVKSQDRPSNLEVTGLRKGGEFPASLNLSPVADSHKIMVGISAISQDLTEKKKMTELLIQSEKMAELGRLGSGIVHEIKNPLTSIMMLTGVVMEMDSLDPKTSKYVGIIDQEARRILRLSQNILSFARPKKPERKSLDLNEIIEETISLVEYELKRNKVQLVLDFKKEGVTVLGDDEKLKQVFLNMIINAGHAMEGGGKLEIKTSQEIDEINVCPDGYFSQTVGEVKVDNVGVVSLRDEGCGISRENMENIFEAFFTTKAEGKGTGLGLYISKNIILGHGGSLTVASKPGEGTVFTIVIPV